MNSGGHAKKLCSSKGTVIMAYDFERAVERLRGKAMMVAKRYRIAMDQRDAAREEIRRLESELESRDREIESLKMKVEYLSVVASARPGIGEMERSRAMLSELVREIDQCISDLQS